VEPKNPREKEASNVEMLEAYIVPYNMTCLYEDMSQ